jgi:ubiquinone/menaquinone biosynthesis C-methylase UbiE
MYEEMVAMSLRGRIFASVYDRQTAKAEAAGLRARRQALLTGVSGRALEIGAGTGANLPFYGPDVELTLSEPEPPMLRRLEARVREHAPGTKVFRAPAEDLPFEDGTFDVVVSTLVLCGVTDQPRALREAHRVLRPGGELRFIEHVRADDEKIARLQQRMNPVNRFLAGCECNRETLRSIRASGFDVTDVEHVMAEKFPVFVRPVIVGRAIAVPGARFGATTAAVTDAS